MKTDVLATVGCRKERGQFQATPPSFSIDGLVSVLVQVHTRRVLINLGLSRCSTHVPDGAGGSDRKHAGYDGQGIPRIGEADWGKYGVGCCEEQCRVIGRENKFFSGHFTVFETPLRSHGSINLKKSQLLIGDGVDVRDIPLERPRRVRIR